MMSRPVTLCLMLLFSASVLHAQGGSIGIYNDLNGFDCDLLLQHAAPVLLVYVFHHSWLGATGVEFSAPVPDCSGVEWIADAVQPPFFVIGTSQVGVSVGYGGCIAGAIRVMDIVAIPNFPPEGCCRWPVLANFQTLGVTPQAFTCDVEPVIVPAWGATSTYTEGGNPVPDCSCYDPLPAEETTWSKVKAMYEN